MTNLILRVSLCGVMRTLKLCYPSKAVQYENVGLDTEDILRRLLVLSGSGQRVIEKKKRKSYWFSSHSVADGAALVTCLCAVNSKGEGCTALAEVPEVENG